MSTIFKYSIIRFQPSADLGEFANIGIVALDAAHRRLQFKLARQRFRRLREFFGDDSYQAYGAAIEHLRIELDQLTQGNGFWSNWEPALAFSHLTRTHESAILFSDERTILTTKPIDEVVDGLFARLVTRQRQEGHDLDLIRDIRQELRQHGIRSFRAIRMEDPVVPVTFPIAHRNGGIKAIHPLVFTQKSPLSVFDHGALWKRRFNYLLDHNKIGDKSILLAVDPPEVGLSSGLTSAYIEAMNEIRALPFETIPAELNGKVNPRIIEFAAESVPQRLFS